MSSFSERQGFSEIVRIQFRTELPERLRHPLFRILSRGQSASFLMERARAVLDPYALGTLPLYEGRLLEVGEDSASAIEFKQVILACKWFEIYDIVENLIETLIFYEEEFGTDPDDFRSFAMCREINEYFLRVGIGWRIEKGLVTARGEDDYENSISNAITGLATSGRRTAADSLRESAKALSRRPEPDLRGAVVNVMGAMECLARDLCSESSATLGAILKKHPDLLPKPLDEAFSKIWGYVSNEARHFYEGQDLSRLEAELAVHLGAAAINYMLQRNKGPEVATG